MSDGDDLGFEGLEAPVPLAEGVLDAVGALVLRVLEPGQEGLALLVGLLAGFVAGAAGLLDGGLGVVEVSPAVAPDLAALGPAVGVAGEEELEALGEAGLPEPLRPTTRVRPGPGVRSRVAWGPMPRKP
jgi:hypothetical protein